LENPSKEFLVIQCSLHGTILTYTTITVHFM